MSPTDFKNELDTTVALITSLRQKGEEFRKEWDQYATSINTMRGGANTHTL